MKKQTVFFIIILFVLASLLGANYFLRPFENINRKGRMLSDPTPTSIISPSPTPDPTQELFDNLVPEQKIGMVLAYPLKLNFDTDINLDFIKNNNINFIILFGENLDYQNINNLIKKIKNNNKNIKIITDHEGGTVQRLSGDGFTKLPSWQKLCSQDIASASALLNKSAQELDQAGVDIVLSPVVDLAKYNQNLKSRICADDPEQVINNANNYIKIFKNNHILPVLKHFPGIGQTQKDLHKYFDKLEIDLDEIAVYQQILDQDQNLGVMVSHVGVSNQDAELPCSLSADCVGELTSNYEQVLVFSDALEMRSAAYEQNASSSAKYNKNLAQIAVEAIMAGNDILIFGPSVDDQQIQLIYDKLSLEYQNNLEFKDKLDASVEKIIKFKFN